MQDLTKFANVAIPKIFNTASDKKKEANQHLVNFFGIDCESLRKDKISETFLTPMYACYDYE